MRHETKENLRDAAHRTETVRDSLLKIGQGEMTSGDADLAFIEKLFSVIKQVEVLRRDIDSLGEFEPNRVFHQSKAPRETRHRVSKEGYPKYSLRDGSIVRTGIGQDELEYEHVVKRRDFETIIDEINKYANSDGFSVDEVLKGLKLPSYLTYLVFSLLKEKLGKLASPKRGRYHFITPQRLNPGDLIDDLRILGEQEAGA